MWRDLSTYTAERLSVIGTNEVGFIDYSGLWKATPTGQQLVYSPSKLITIDSCADQDLVINPSGIFLYAPGCLGSSILRGNIDGSGVDKLYDPMPNPINGGNFLCEARDPAGGFYMIVDDIGGGSPRMYHVAEDANGAVGLTHVVTDPSFGEARFTQSENVAFEYCSLATAPDGTVYFQTESQLWKVSPP